MDSKQLKHVIVTRFNCHFAGMPRDHLRELRTSLDWLERRMVLFRHYCAPTVLSQSNQDFFWYIYLDRETPPAFLDRFEDVIGGRPNVLLKICDSFGLHILQADLAYDLQGTCDWLLTTRLDNDDGLHNEFVERLRRQIRPGMREGLNFPLGLVLGPGRLYRSRQPSNAFITLSEPFPGSQTVFCARHNEFGTRVPVRDIVENTPAWIQVVHDCNLSNKIRGKRIGRHCLAQGFEAIDLSDMLHPSDSTLSLVTENLTLVPLRFVRDKAAQACRRFRRLLAARPN